MNPNEYIAYYRVSTSKQGESGLGLDAQRESVQRFSSNGTILAEYIEVETGTNKRDRPQLQEALEQCRKTGATLVVAKIDRLSRSVVFVSSLLESSVQFIVADMPSANTLTLHLMAAIGEHESVLISERTRVALQAAKARGTVLGKPENFTSEGRRKGNETMRLRAANAYAAILPMIQQLKQAGHTLADIASKLNQTGQTNSRGNAFNAKQVSRILARN